jgi:signal transduction histidine kinase
MPCRPPWWPHNEPWPPRSGARPHGYATRVRFFRRFAIVAAALMLCAATGFVTFLWLAASSIGLLPARPGSPPILSIAGLVTGLGALVTIVMLLGVLRRAGGPLARIMEAADQVADGNYDVQVAERGPQPIRALARAFNTMTGRLRAHDRLRRDLMADVAHELRTPLTIVQGKVEGLLDGVYPLDAAQLHEVLDETRVLARLVEDLRTLALTESGALQLQREPTDLGALAADVVHAFDGDAARAGVRVAVDRAGNVARISIDPVRIREVIANLVSNAIRHTPAGGSVVVRASPTADGAAVEVRDTGNGMTPDELAHAFDRFYKGPQSRGSGLGLTIARNLVAAHGGQIQASSAAGGGVTVAFTLPAV